MVKVKFIGHRILIFAIIAAIVNVYAFEYWCNVRLPAQAAAHGPSSQAHPHSHVHPDQAHTHASAGHTGHGPASGSGHSHSSSHHHAEAGNHHAESGKPTAEKEAGCCQDETANFFSALHAQALTKIHIAPLDLPMLLPVCFASFHLTALQDWQQDWPFHPDVGLRPKIPNIRIFLCSLTI